MSLKLYNTLTRKKEIFKPIKKNSVGFYGCGPTVYWYQHIGNLRRYIFEDILYKTLFYNKFKVKHIINITDVGHLTSDADEGEDKMMKAIKREGLPLTKESMLKIAKKYENVFRDDLRKLNISEPDKWVKATEHVKEMIELIKKIWKKGFAYETNEAVYFDISKFKNYWKLAKLDLDNLKAGARVEIKEDKKNPHDFALWFKGIGAHAKDIMQWDSPWGRGFPGWHIECSAMSIKYLGEQFDIHTGGIDHVPVHHTNEIAQVEAATGKSPWVKYWLHCNHLILKKGKMSKSDGSILKLSDLGEKGFSPMEFKYLCLLTHYRKKLVFDFENLKSAQRTYQRLKNILAGLKEDGKTNKKYLKEFGSAMDDDLNTPRALQVLWKFVRDEKAGGKIQTIKKMDEVFGLDLLKKEKVKIPAEVKKLVGEREKARERKNWGLADELREKIKKMGYVVSDTKRGAEVKKK